MSLNEFALTFSGFDLTSIPDVYWSRRFPHDLPRREIKSGRLARNHGEKVLSSFYSTKTIVLEGYIEATDRTNMEIARDVLVFRLQPQEANLDIVVAGFLRTFIVTMENIAFTPVEGGRMLFSVEFRASDPFGRDTSQTALSFDAPKTVATFDYPLTIGGSFAAELVISVALASGSGLTSNKTITLANPATGESIAVTRDWAAPASLLLNVPNKQVTVDGSVVDYNGVFPLYQPGPQILRYTDTFTTRSVSLSGSYYKRYL